MLIKNVTLTPELCRALEACADPYPDGQPRVGYDTLFVYQIVAEFKQESYPLWDQKLPTSEAAVGDLWIQRDPGAGSELTHTEQDRVKKLLNIG